MKWIKGALVLVIVFAVTAAIWYTAQPIESMSSLEKISYVVGGLAIAGYSLTFLLAVRNRLSDSLFGGLERVYFFHKLTAVLALVFTLLHGQLVEIADEGDERERYEESASQGTVYTSGFVSEVADDDGDEYEYDGYQQFDGEERDSLAHTAKELGELSQNAFIFLILVAFLAKFLKYEHWRFVHRLMIVPYAIGLFHMYFTGKFDLFTFTPVGILMGIMAIGGLVAAIYMLFGYQHVQFTNGSVARVERLTDDMLEIELTLSKAVQYEKGQYIFLKVFQQGIERAPHPFSIAGGDGQTILLSVKVAGDYTKALYESLQVGAVVSIDGPYGHMKLEEGQDRQVWIAGGSGIAPFLSHLKTVNVTQQIDLYYTYRGEQFAAHKPFLQQYASEHANVKVHFHDSTVNGRLRASDIAIEKGTTVFMCGPKKMMKSFATQLRSSKEQPEIVFEQFSFK